MRRLLLRRGRGIFCDRVSVVWLEETVVGHFRVMVSEEAGVDDASRHRHRMLTDSTGVTEKTLGYDIHIVI